ncbi:MAG: GGDEF domain-containing protein [Oscillospiraceae bacterium]|jgi:GGDEF domain-containing protein|nr:GGDEF domain-containing protein [Oscillospiraceae bacterium]MCI9307887.1 GGDEF domain-containing protein [Oscillospiraceae bacterium]MCI9548116.1 GGDEF domain-containing protein [Oscillospiraceae bacterium]
MKELDVFRYLKKYRAAIAGFSVLAGIVFFLAAQLRIQQYTAATVIEYTGARAAEGLSPDGTPIDTTEIYSTNLVAQAMKALDIDYAQATTDDIRMGIQVEPVITEEDLKIQQSKLDNGEEDYELNPTRYLVTFSCGVGSGKDFPRRVLDQILQEYAAYYGKTHVNTALAANPVSDITAKGYDYLEMAEVMDATLEDMVDHLTDKVNWNGEFRSSRTGLSFQDLKDEFSFLRQVEVRQLFSQILEGKITKDRDVLLDKYRNRNNDLAIANTAVSFEIDRIRGIIGSYESAMGEFGAVSGAAGEDGETYQQNNVLPDVYDERDQDPDGNWTPVDRTAEYDKLLMKYIEDRTLYEHALIDGQYNDYILGVFAGAPARSPQAAQERVLGEIQRLAEKINALQAVYYETNDEYNEYLGVRNIVMLSSVRVTERFPILLFTALIVVIFGALGCAGAAVFGRIEDFIEYYAFTNKVDGLPNRAKCDQFITAREGRPIPEGFACVVFRLSQLQSVNARQGREAGDRLIKDFVAVLTSVFAPSDKLFVGNNGAGQYLVFAESMGRDQVEAALFQMGVVLEERGRDTGRPIQLCRGFACAGEEKCYYIRELLSTAMKRVDAAPAGAGGPVSV